MIEETKFGTGGSEIKGGRPGEAMTAAVDERQKKRRKPLSNAVRRRAGEVTYDRSSFFSFPVNITRSTVLSRLSQRSPNICSVDDPLS